MFKFNFDLGDSHEGGGDDPIDTSVPDAVSGLGWVEEIVKKDASEEINLDDLIAALPPTISFSPLSITLSADCEVHLSRRDLFDARFQLISDDDAGAKDGRSDIDFVDAPSDLVPGVYEGGLKTWECSLDLVECMQSIYGDELPLKMRGKRILELGCGTAVPSLYALHTLFSARLPTDAEADVHVHLQDYNDMVLRLVTLPNIILAWYMSPASSTYRTASEVATHTDKPKDDDEGEEPDPLPPADASQPGELPITPALTAAFLESLKAYRIHLKFFKGAWATFDVGRAGGSYDLLLTSETIYRMASLGSLVDMMKRATATSDRKDGSGDGIEHAASKLTLTDADGLKALSGEPHLCLVAAKLVYFGVGGGVNEFSEVVERISGRVETIWERNRGVRRSIMRVVWETL